MRALAVIAFLFAPAVAKAPALRAYNVDPAKITVSGISSGAYFAEQVAVAFSSQIVGAGLIAGGPYHCGGERPYAECMRTARPDPAIAIERAKQWSGKEIDDVKNLSRMRIYLFSGMIDQTVSASVVDATAAFFAAFVPANRIFYEKSVASAHTFPTDHAVPGGNACKTTASPFISDCGFDTAGALLAHLLGSLRPPSDSPKGQLLPFDQSEFRADPDRYGLDGTGWIYVPASCATGTRCRLHVVFHGCLQGHAAIGDLFMTNAGYNRWADTNDLIILYPQAVADKVDHKPQPSGAGANVAGCWDWLGYYGPDFDRKSGVQLSAVKAMIDRIAKR